MTNKTDKEHWREALMIVRYDIPLAIAGINHVLNERLHGCYVSEIVDCGMSNHNPEYDSFKLRKALHSVVLRKVGRHNARTQAGR